MDRRTDRRLPEPVPERLREARLARGYTTAQLAEALGVTRQAVSKFELGHMRPSGPILAKIVEVLRLPLGYLCSQMPCPTPEGTAFFRSLKSATKTAREMLLIRAKWLERIMLYLEQYLDFPEVNLPDLGGLTPNGVLSDEEIEEIAAKARKHWGLGFAPIDNMVLLLERHGVVVTRIQFEDLKTDAFSQWRGDRPYVFLGSDKESAVRSRFDAAHELAHLLLHMWVEEGQLADPNVFEQIEREANRFAGAFLLPRETFSVEVMSTSLQHFIHLKKRWKTSIAAMITRCAELGILSESQVLYLRKQMARLKLRAREPLDDELMPEQPTMLRQAVTMLIEHGVQTPAEIVDHLKLPPDEIEALCNLPRGVLCSEGKVVPLRLKRP